jgi:hypothetical protein
MLANGGYGTLKLKQIFQKLWPAQWKFLCKGNHLQVVDENLLNGVGDQHFASVLDGCNHQEYDRADSNEHSQNHETNGLPCIRANSAAGYSLSFTCGVAGVAET